MLKCHVLTTRLPLTVLIGLLLDTDQYEYGCLDITGTARLGKIGSLGHFLESYETRYATLLLCYSDIHLNCKIQKGKDI